MVVINCAYTERLNPPGSALVLNQDQIWRGLQRKIRRAQDFVPSIASCDVLEDSGSTVVREATFKSEDGKSGLKVREVCKSFPKSRVDFWQPDGALVTNTISGFVEEDYQMTYSFERRYPDVSEGSEEHKRLEKEVRDEAKMAVHFSIESMHRLAAAGELD